MNTMQEHIDKAVHNREFLSTLDASRFPDWAIVALFYRALHVTSAVVHARGDDHGTSHPSRQRAVERHFGSDNALAYEQLYSRSRLVRYDQLSATESEYEQLVSSFLPILTEAQSVMAVIQ